MKRPLLLAITLLAAACGRRSTPAPVPAEQPVLALAPPAPAAEPTCESRIEQLRCEPSLPGTPALDAVRMLLFGMVKAEPVVFLSPPRESQSERAGAAVLRAQLRRTRYPADLIRAWGAHFRADPLLGREVLLRDGYLYAESLELGRALSEEVRLEHVTRAPRVRVQRGAAEFEALREPRTRKYVYADGPDQGRPVVLVLFDRVLEGEELAPLHRDLRELRSRMGFDRATVLHATAEQLVAVLRYGELEVPTLLRSEGARLHKVCEQVEPGTDTLLGAARADGLVREAVMERIRAAVVEQVQEGLPFDEPRKEFGQQDGILRGAWRRAYDRGQGSYRVNGDDYEVFNAEGRPWVPQVCLDFLTDTLERAAGSWWAGQEEPRARSQGRLDLVALGLGRSRSVDNFLSFVRTRPELFDLHAVPLGKQVEFRQERAVLQYLAEHRDEYRAGDMVLIRGHMPETKKRKSAPREQHYHSFFVYETDPATGVPGLIAGNAGRPRITTWLREIRRTPARTIQYRIRASASWLAEHFELDGPLPERPASIAPGSQQG